ncbi:MAG TPA: PIN domain-containing protein [Acidimicrobiales bacterium]|nr:PIN domain-containing protein [Acidimicrobiales bacterium]
MRRDRLPPGDPFSLFTDTFWCPPPRSRRTVPRCAARLPAPFEAIPVDRAVAERAGRIRRETGLRLPDALIAATALERGLTLTTRNRRHFEAVPGLGVRAPT